MRISPLAAALALAALAPLPLLAQESVSTPPTLPPGGLLTEPGDYKYEAEPYGTFSIVALDPETGQLGVAAIASQASSNRCSGRSGSPSSSAASRRRRLAT